MTTAYALFKKTEPKIKNDYFVIFTGRLYVLLDVGTKYMEFLHGLSEKNEIGHYLVPCNEFFLSRNQKARIDKRNCSKKTPYNRKFLKRSKNGPFAKAMVKQNGHIYREVERKGLLILQYVFLFSNILRKTEKGRF